MNLVAVPLFVGAAGASCRPAVIAWRNRRCCSSIVCCRLAMLVYMVSAVLLGKAHAGGDGSA